MLCASSPTNPGTEQSRGLAWEGLSRSSAVLSSWMAGHHPAVSERSLSPAGWLLGPPLGRSCGCGGAAGFRPAWQNVCPVASLQT